MTLVLEPNKSPGYTYCIYKKKTKGSFFGPEFFQGSGPVGSRVSTHFYVRVRVGSGLGSEIGDPFHLWQVLFEVCGYDCLAGIILRNEKKIAELLSRCR